MSCSPFVADRGHDIVLPRCPGLRVLNYETSWHVLSGAPNFLICTRCFADHIQDMPLAPCFTRVKTMQGRCHFHVPRVAVLWRLSVQSQDMSPLFEYAKRRSRVPDCSGPSGAGGVVEWYYTPDAGLPVFIVCEACYADYVAGTAFTIRFERFEGQGSSSVWKCGFAVPAIRAAFGHYSAGTHGEWDKFAAARKRRMGLPACGSGKQMKRLRIHGIGLEMNVCEACYEDNITLRKFEENFEVWGGQDVESEGRTCSFATRSLAFAYDLALESGDFDVFKTAASAISSAESYDDSGNCPGGLRYGVIGDDILDVCPACYAGIIFPLGLASTFESKVVKGQLCALRAGFFSFEVCVRRLREAADKGSLDTFLSWAREVVDTPSCPGSVLTSGLEWYGWEACTICPECYHTVAYGTCLVSEFTLRRARVVEPTMCCLHSENMRQRYRDACAKGNPTDLFQFARSRRVAYDDDAAQTEGRSHSDEERVQMAEYYLAMNIQGRIHDSIAGISGDFDEHDTRVYGNDELGWYQTGFGVEAEMYDRMANLLITEGEDEDDWGAEERLGEHGVIAVNRN